MWAKLIWVFIMLFILLFCKSEILKNKVLENCLEVRYVL